MSETSKQDGLMAAPEADATYHLNRKGNTQPTQGLSALLHDVEEKEQERKGGGEEQRK